MVERLAFEQLHGDEALAIRFADVIEGTDVGMVQGGGGAGLALKALERLRIARKIFRKKFERDVAAQASVLGLVNDAHAACAQLGENAVVRDGLADHAGLCGAPML